MNAMEQIVLIAVAIAAVYWLVKIVVETCTTIDDNLTARRQRRK